MLLHYFPFGIEVFYSRELVPHTIHQTHVQVSEGNGHFVYGKMYPNNRQNDREQFGKAQLATKNNFAVADEKA
ncbi:MAG TPA: hypothetical protein VHD35_04715 [Chitinophagaceae bacterium]|nr:hypothetical protein [Chitinophagaceae bacterium]